MDIARLIQFDGNFFPDVDGNPSKMDQKVKKRFSGSIVKTVYANATEASRAKATDPKLWKLVLGLQELGPTSIALATTADGGYAEVTDKVTGNMVCARVQFVEGPFKAVAKFSAVEITPLGVMAEYGASRRGTALLAAHLAWAVKNDAEAAEIIEDLKPLLIEDSESSRWDDETVCEKVGTLLCKLSSNIYYYYKNRVEIDENLTRLRNEDFALIKVREVFYGTLKKISVSEKKVEGFLGMFNLDEKRVLTDEEKEMVPVLSPSFQFEPWMLTLAQDVQESGDFEEPFRVLLLYGPSGTGKTQATSGLAYLWNRPKLTWSSDPDADEFKLVGSIMPNTEGGERIETNLNLDEIATLLSLPTFDDIEFDFQRSYERLFGKKPTKYSTQAECYRELTVRIMKSNICNKDFNFVKSEIMRAFEQGWVVEIQEPTIIKRASVLVALNAMLECDCNSATITLPTGKTIKRHPEAIVIYTTNRDYAGCIDLQSSVLSRIDCIRYVPNPEEDVLVSRIMAKTSCTDKRSLKKMAGVVAMIYDYCKKRDIRDGVCGSREFSNWVKKAMMLQKRETGSATTLSEENVCKAACSTLFEHISQVDEDREDVITAIFQKQYKETVVVEAKKAYEMGMC